MVQKIKFKIKGMHCNSCAMLIEEKLKSQPGVIEAKVNYDSKKAVVVYDEQKIQESEIKRTIEEIGSYKAERIEENKKENTKERDYYESEPKEENKSEPPSNVYFWLGFFIAFSIFSFVLNIILLKPFLNLKNLEVTGGTIARNESTNPTVNSPLPSQDNTQPTIQTFEITTKDHVRGDFNAPITLVEFSDFECPFCARHYPTLKKIFGRL